LAKYRLLVASFARAVLLLVIACRSIDATTEVRGVTPCEVSFTVEIDDNDEGDGYDIGFIQLGETHKKVRVRLFWSDGLTTA
jgi:hypothetical protein